jgi:hypothetical protein
VVEGLVGRNIQDFCDSSSQKWPCHKPGFNDGDFAIFKNPSQRKHLGTEGNQSVTNCNGFKMLSHDGFIVSASSAPSRSHKNFFLPTFSF